MFCPKCGNEIPDDSAFCMKCGKTLTKESTPAASPDTSTPQPKQSKSGKIILSLIVVAIAGLIGSQVCAPMLTESYLDDEAVEPMMDVEFDIPTPDAAVKIIKRYELVTEVENSTITLTLHDGNVCDVSYHTTLIGNTQTSHLVDKAEENWNETARIAQSYPDIYISVSRSGDTLSAELNATNLDRSENEESAAYIAGYFFVNASSAPVSGYAFEQALLSRGFSLVNTY